MLFSENVGQVFFSNYDDMRLSHNPLEKVFFPVELICLTLLCENQDKKVARDKHIPPQLLTTVTAAVRQ